ncbi:MAG: hypothetical protein KGZ86_08660 [Candidatus Latescibacteria bacterium]|nr:hypothetical protein [Candidatus Latescibacterota bacterium]
MKEKKDIAEPPVKPEETEESKTKEGLKRFDFLGVGEMIAFLRNPFKVFFLNVVAGIGRGFGFAIGFMLLAAILILVMKRAVSVPVIGGYIAKILEFIEAQRQMMAR